MADYLTCFDPNCRVCEEADTLSNVNSTVVQTNTARKGDFILTHSRKHFWPLDPRSDEVDIEDIAHALSMTCRWGGHPDKFYSVAEHSVIVSKHVPPQHALWGLLHDASEAYIADLARPVKRNIPGYVAIELDIMRVVADRFNLSWPEPESVKDADNRILRDEIDMLMPGHPWRPYDGKPLEPLGVFIMGYSPPAAKSLFLRRFEEITR